MTDLRDLTSFEAWGNNYLVALSSRSLMVMVQMRVNVKPGESVVDFRNWIIENFRIHALQ